MPASYEEAVAAATTDQGLDPVVEVLKDEFPNVAVDQTGGFTMVARVSAADGGWVGITESENFSAHGDIERPEGFYLVGYLDVEDEGNAIADGVALEHIADYVRGFVRAHGGLDDVGRILAEYERVARQNRPDWDAFIAEAKADPATIAYEVADTARDLGIDIDIDAVFVFAQEWVRQLPAPAPVVTVTTAQLRRLRETWIGTHDTFMDAVDDLIAQAESEARR